MRILAFYALILVFIVISLVLPMRFLECITVATRIFWCFRVICVVSVYFTLFQYILRCSCVIYVVLMKNGKKWQNIANGGG